MAVNQPIPVKFLMVHSKCHNCEFVLKRACRVSVKCCKRRHVEHPPDPSCGQDVEGNERRHNPEEVAPQPPNSEHNDRDSGCSISIETECDDFCGDHDRRHRTHLKSPLPGSSMRVEDEINVPIAHSALSMPRNKLVFIVYQNDPGFREMLGKFADIMRSVGHVTVKLDFECQEKNRKDVKAWAGSTLEASTNVVIVLSESFLKICRSYRGSKTMEMGSCSAYSDIAPQVLDCLSLRNNMGFAGRAVFVHFGMANAKEDYQQLLEWYWSPPVQGDGSTGQVGGEPMSAPALGVPAGHGSTSSPPGPAAVSGAQSVCGPHFHSGSVPNHLLGPQRSSSPSSQLGSDTLTDGQRSFSSQCSPEPVEGRDQSPPPYSTLDQEWVRHRYPSAPQQATCDHSSRPRRHCSAPGQSPPCPPPYDAGCPNSPSHSSSCQTSRVHPSLPSAGGLNSGRVTNSTAVDSSCRCPAPAQPCRSFPADPSAPLHDRGATAACLHAGQTPKLIALRGEQGLKKFLQELCPGLPERSIDEAVRGPHAQDLIHFIERRLNDQNQREPVQHSCYSSPTGSNTNVAVEHSERT